MFIEVEKNLLFNNLAEASSAAITHSEFLIEELEKLNDTGATVASFRQNFDDLQRTNADRDRLHELLIFMRDKSWYNQGTRYYLSHEDAETIHYWVEEGRKTDDDTTG